VTRAPRTFPLEVRTRPAGAGYTAIVELRLGGGAVEVLAAELEDTEFAAIRRAMARAGERLSLRLVAEATAPSSCPVHGIACPDGPLLKGREKK